MEEILTALLAPVAGGNRYWVRKPQSVETSHYVVMQRISGPRDYHMQGASGYVPYRVQIDVYALTYESALATCRLIRALLSGYRNGPIKGIFFDGERALPAADPGEVNDLFRISIDAIIHYSA